MIEDKIKDEIISRVELKYPGVNVSAKDLEVTRPSNSNFGDFSTNIAFKLAGQLKKDPNEIAKELAADMANWDAIAKAEAVKGFLNIYLEKEMFHEVIREILTKKEHYGDSEIKKDEKVQVEFISANPTGPLTLANGRGGFGGDVLARVFAKAGAKVQREYLINDGGNQVKILGDSVLVAAGLLKKDDDIYKGEYIQEWVMDNKKIIEEHQDKPKELGQIAAKDILEKLIKPSVKGMKINFDNWFSEQKLIESGEVDKALTDFDKRSLTYTEDNALWFRTTKYGDDKDRVLRKADGENTYFANDTAYHWDKFAVRKFDKVINFWGADHHGYIGRMQAAVEAIGFGGKLDIVIMQMVRLIQNGKEVRMSKRKGTYITMDDLFEMIGGKDASDVARFFFLSRAFNTHMDFDLDAAKERSEKNPVFYVKYAHARIHGILDKAKFKSNKSKIKLELLVAPEEIELIDELSQLESVVRSIVTFSDYPVHFLTFYAIEIAKRFHSFYDRCRVIDEENLDLTIARLELVKATQIVLRVVMEDLIGIEAPERM